MRPLDSVYELEAHTKITKSFFWFVNFNHMAISALEFLFDVTNIFFNGKAFWRDTAVIDHHFAHFTTDLLRSLTQAIESTDDLTLNTFSRLSNTK